VQNIKVYDTDGDDPLSGAFNLVYPNAYHLLCDIHIKDNIEQKLKDLCINNSNQLKIVNTIFGLKVNENI
jgi:hypothetical protein